MSAIITDNFRRNNAKLFLNDIAGKDSGGNTVTAPNNYYLGIGKSDKWPNAGAVTEDGSGYSVAVPVGSFSDGLEVLNNIATLSKLGAANTTLVIPNVAWASGNRYKAYNSYDSSCFYATGNILPCYATTATGMYLCLAAGGSSTVNAPSDTTDYAPNQGGDGYVWILVQPVSSSGSAFITDQFIEVRQTALTNPSTAYTNCSTYGGLVSRTFHIANGGTGYTTPPAVVLRGSDGTQSKDSTYFAALTATVAGGAITGVTLTDSTLSAWPVGLQAASVEISGGGGSGAVVVPIIAPRLGYGYIPSAVMPSWYAGIAVDLADTISSDNFYTPYRQVSVVRNPNTTASTANALRSLTLSGTVPTVDINNNTLIYDTNDKPLAIADAIVGSTLYFHQNYTSGFREIPANGSFHLAVGGTNYTYSALTASECASDGVYPRITGEVVFVENRKKITRGSGQTEKIKIIIQF